jgi:hypothetical protein
MGSPQSDGADQTRKPSKRLSAPVKATRAKVAKPAAPDLTAIHPTAVPVPKRPPSKGDEEVMA